MPKFQLGVQLDPYDIKDTVRLGGNAGATPLKKEDDLKLLKLVGDSRYDLCAVGDKVEGIVEVAGDLVATFDGYTLGSIQKRGRFVAVADGSEAAGTGSLAVGDCIVAGTPIALNVAITEAGPRVRKATNQPGAAVTVPDNLQASINTALASLKDQVSNTRFCWRVVAILSGTGAVGDKVLVERVHR